MFSISGLWVSLGLRPLTLVKRHWLLRPEVPGTIASVFSWCMGQKSLELMGVISYCSGTDEALQTSGGGGETVGIPHFNFAPTECVGSEVFLRLISPTFPVLPFDFCFLLPLPVSFILFLLFTCLLLHSILSTFSSFSNFFFPCFICIPAVNTMYALEVPVLQSMAPFSGPSMYSYIKVYPVWSLCSQMGLCLLFFSVFSFPPFCNLGEQVSEMPEVTQRQIKAVTQTQVWLTLIPHLFSVHINIRLKFISFST